MTVETSTTATQTFPLTAGAALSSLEDPVALGLIDYFAYWLNTSINPQLAVMTGHSATAVPTNNTAVSPIDGIHRCAYDPLGVWVRNAKPALYVWWKTDTRAQWSTLKDMSTATYGFMYVSDEVVAPAGSQHGAGIIPTVRRVLRRANDLGFHPNYAYGSDPNGTPLYRSLGLASWNITRMEWGAMVPIPATSTNVGGQGEGGIIRYFPAVTGDIEVLEIVGQTIPRVPEDVMGDVTIDIRTNETGDVGNVLQMLERVLPAPDGSEQP